MVLCLSSFASELPNSPSHGVSESGDRLEVDRFSTAGQTIGVYG